jgi:HEPN domain-containing protein
MKNPELVEYVKKWLKFAKENLLFAKAGMEQDFSPYHSICFMCQSSAEKYLKSFLIWNDWELRKLHDLSVLLEFCCEYDLSFEDFYSDCELLNEYIIAARYPTDISFESITKKDAEKAIEAAEKIQKHVKRKINFPITERT